MLDHRLLAMRVGVPFLGDRYEFGVGIVVVVALGHDNASRFLDAEAVDVASADEGVCAVRAVDGEGVTEIVGSDDADGFVCHEGCGSRVPAGMKVEIVGAEEVPVRFEEPSDTKM